MITLTDQAIENAEKWRDEEDEYNGKDIRLCITGKGCDGFYYAVSFDQLTEAQDHIFSCSKSLSVGIDKESLPYVKDTVISWVDDERGKGFWVDNPSHKKFKGKFYKKKSFPDWLEAAKGDADHA